ncbi:hypothetical protein HOY34_20605 [Xinfangfangia sp. D13-10-4-6]|uniref:hypothetical protein n=1 Tax=Pseudogemmobacter hezensis TaxID=2737662 RepID=UPI0015540DDA|nr:hypothetical protein [Pseudogemmobacter hezensis]NPD17590.1 hypothetical protein [Pseudogemmobacter hezensis]
MTAIAADVHAGLASVGNTLTITRTTPGTPDPEQLWIDVPGQTATETVPQFGEGSGRYRSGETVVTTDFEFMIAVPKVLIPQEGDLITAGDETATIVRAEPFPAGGQPVYFTIWADR